MTTPVKKVPIHLQSAQNRLLIRDGNVINEDHIANCDVYIEDGIIKEMGRNLIIPGGTRIIQARNKYVLPGGIDPHTHFELEMMGAKSVDDFYQGTKAAIAGGTTMIMDFVIPRKDESLIEAYERYRETADQKVCCDYALHVAITSWSPKVKEDMATLVKKHGVNSFKVFMAYKDTFMLRDPELIEVFKTCKELGAIAMVHAENGDIIAENTKRLLEAGVTGPEGHEMSRPEEVEAEAVYRACVLANQVNCPLYVTAVTGKLAADIIGTKKSEGNIVFGETVVSAVAIDGSMQYGKDMENGRRFVTSPPLRPDSSTPEHLIKHLVKESLQVVASDHCTFSSEQKALGKDDFSKIPNGVNGVEDRMSVLWEKVKKNESDPMFYVAYTSTNAAKIFNLYPRKGAVLSGSDADVVVWNFDSTRTISAKTHVQAVDFNIFEGMEVHGVPEYVIVGGRLCVDEGELKAVHGFGKFIETPSHPKYVYNMITEREKRPRGVARTEAEEKKHAEEDAATAKANEEARAQAAEAANKALDENYSKPIKTEPDCVPTLPGSAVVTPSSKGPRLEGQRNLQVSTFSLTEDVSEGRRSCVRLCYPPGGYSAGGFW